METKGYDIPGRICAKGAMPAVTNGDRTPEVRLCLEEMECTIASLDEQVKRLYERVQPVLRQTDEAPPQPTPTTPSGPITRTAVGIKLRTLTDQLKVISQVVLTLNSCIEL